MRKVSNSDGRATENVRACNELRVVNGLRLGERVETDCQEVKSLVTVTKLFKIHEIHFRGMQNGPLDRRTSKKIFKNRENTFLLSFRLFSQPSKSI